MLLPYRRSDSVNATLRGINMMMRGAALVLALVVSAEAQASIVNFTIEGRLTGVQYDYVGGVVTDGPGGPASTALLAAVPLGSSYSLTYSYDTNAAATYTYPNGAYFTNLPIAGSFTLGGTSFSLPTTNVFVGSNGFGVRYSVAGNFPLPSTDQLAGFRGIDFSFDVSRPTPGGGLGTTLPASVELADFPNQYARVRFVNDAYGETGIFFSITSISSSTAGAVPEPATWAMMIGGFGMVGGAMRRRRVNTKVSFA